MKQTNNTRQNELLKKYYSLDENNKNININFNYEKASDILDVNIGNPEYPLFKDEVLERVNSVIENNNPLYKVELNFEIEDYESYSPKNIIESFNDTLELRQYSARRKRMLKDLICAILALVGTLLLLTMVIIKQENMISDETNNEVITEIINIVAWVFIWEAAYMLFLEHSEQTKFALRIRKNVSKIALYKKGNPKPLASEDSKQVFGNWENEGKLKKLGQKFTLISSIYYIFYAFYSIYTTYRYIKVNHDTISIVLSVIVLLFAFAIPMLAGLGGICLYLNSNKKIRKFVGPYAILLTLGLTLSIIFAILSHDLLILISSTFSFLMSIFYTLGYYFDKYIK